MAADYGFNALPVQRILIFVKKLSIANTELKVMSSFTYTLGHFFDDPDDSPEFR